MMNGRWHILAGSAALVSVLVAPLSGRNLPRTDISVLGEQDYAEGQFINSNGVWNTAQSNEPAPFNTIHTPSTPIVFTHTGLDTGRGGILTIALWDLDSVAPGDQIAELLLDGVPQSLAIFEVNEPNESVKFFQIPVDASFLSDGAVTVSLTIGQPPAGNEVGIDFARLELLPEPPDGAPPVVNCGSPDGQWHPNDVQITCTAQDEGSGLANAGDASFVLTTAVPADTETANAQTGQRSVCDLDGNCVTVGPIGGNKVDKKGPSVTIATPAAGTYLLNQQITASYSCLDGGSGVASCTGPVPSGQPIVTSVPGPVNFAVGATDNVGNAASLTVIYSVRYNVCLLYDPSKAKKSGSTIPIKLQLCDASGANVSSPGTAVVATSIVQVSSGDTTAAEDAGSANPDSNFRYDASLGGYIFNLQTTGLALGGYQLRFVPAGDTTVYTVGFTIGK